MKKIDKEELKKIQLKILDTLDAFCKENNIKYWIDYGTLIGAIRHEGYIPWDDDIDVGMLRDDYNKLLKNFNNQNDRYKIYSYDNNKDFLYAYGKLIDTNTILYEPDENGNKLSVNIDIFVYDNAPNDEKLCKRILREKELYNLIQYCRISYPMHDNFKKNIIHIFLKYFSFFFSKDFFVKRISSNAQKYMNINTENIGSFTSYSSVILPKKMVENITKVKFEGKLYNAPQYYDEWLKSFYGNYMELPPIEQRVSHHKFIAYYK